MVFGGYIVFSDFRAAFCRALALFPRIAPAQVKNGVRAVLSPVVLTFAVFAVESAALPGEAYAEVDGAQKCRDAGWNVSGGGGLCDIRIDNADRSPEAAGLSRRQENCRLVAPYWHRPCHEAFGPNYDFPQRTEENKDDYFIYNCDKDGAGDSWPATGNTNGETSCSCTVTNKAGECEACPAGRARLTPPNNDLCVEIGRLEVLEWCQDNYSSIGSQVRVPNTEHTQGLESLHTGEFYNAPNEHAHQAGKYSCYYGTAKINQHIRWASNSYPADSLKTQCTNAGYTRYFDDSRRQTSRHLGADNSTHITEVDYYCMPPQRGGTFNLDFDGCAQRNPNAKWHVSARACVFNPTAPRNVRVSVRNRGSAVISWDKPLFGFADEYVIRAGEPANNPVFDQLPLINAAELVTIAAGRNPSNLFESAASHTVTVDGLHNRRNNVYFEVDSVSRLFPDAETNTARSSGVDLASFEVICRLLGWTVSEPAFSLNGKECNIPVVDATDRTEHESCVRSEYFESSLKSCGNIFSDPNNAGEWVFPPYEAGVRYVYNCPFGSPSADWKTCVCPNTEDYSQVGQFCVENASCEEQNRIRISAHQCGGCAANFTEAGGECRQNRNCAAENRESSVNAYECGGCVAGYRTFSRFEGRDFVNYCRRDLRMNGDAVAAHCPGAGGEPHVVISKISAAGLGDQVGQLCEFPSSGGKESCYGLNYERPGADASVLYKLALTGGQHALGDQISANTRFCDDAYPVCSEASDGGIGYVKRDGNPLKGCVCPAQHVAQQLVGGGSACRFDCMGVRNRENGAELSTCGACLSLYVEDELGGEACQLAADCESENRLRINEYTCGGCLANYGVDDDGKCQAETACPAGRLQLTPYQCGRCAAGYAESETEVATVEEGGDIKAWPACLRSPCPSGFRDANGNCPETPQAAQCLDAAADGASLKRWGAKLDDGRCLPVQTCLFGIGSGALTPLRQAAASSQMTGCHLWSDTGRPEAGFRAMTVTAGVTVKASVSYLRESGECSGEQRVGEFQVDGYANPTLYAPSCHAGLFNCPNGLKDPNNPFSLCKPNLDHGQTNCEAAGGVWKPITSQPDDPASLERADSCKIGADVCYTDAKKNFDETVGTFYDYSTLQNRPGEHLTPVERDAQYPLSGYVYPNVVGACETAHPSTCEVGALRVAGNPFSGCVSVPVRSPGVPRVSASTVGASLAWEPSEVVGAATLLGYSVLRATDGAAVYMSVAFTTATTYTDAGAPAESEVRYRIRAEVPSGDDSLVSDPSREVRIPGCLLDAHKAVERRGLPPLCVPQATQAAAQKCADAGWGVVYTESAFVRCAVSSRDAQSGQAENCGLWGSYENGCSDVFGADFDFPTNDGHTRQFVFNCGANRIPDPTYLDYARNPRQECVCEGAFFEDARTGECTLCSDLNRESSPVAGICGGCMSPSTLQDDGTCNVERAVRATPIPSAGGAVIVSGLDGAGSGANQGAKQGAYVTFTARPAAGWYVSGWEGDFRCADASKVGSHVNPDEEKVCVLRVNADVDLTIHFTAARTISYSGLDVSARRTGADGGAAVNSGDTLPDGATIVFSAALAEGFKVFEWLNHGAAVAACGQNAACTLAADGADLDVVGAVREILGVSYGSEPANGGVVTVAGLPSGGISGRGIVLTFSATPAAGWYVGSWNHPDCFDKIGSLDTVNAQKACIVTVNASLNVVAGFENGGVAPFAPRDFSAALLGSGQSHNARLSWSPPEGVFPPISGWLIQRASVAAESPAACAAADFSGQYADYSVSVTAAGSGSYSAIDSGLAYGGCLGYRLAGLNLRGPGAWGFERVYVFAPPSAPSDVSASLQSQFVSLGWSPPAEWNGAALAEYEIWRDAGGAAGFAPIGASRLLSYVDMTPPSSSTVRYRVLAQSNAGASGLSPASGSVVVPRISYAVSYSHSPSNGRGGILSARGIVGGRVESGRAVTFTATPAAGWVVSHWSGTGEEFCPRGPRNGATGAAAAWDCVVSPSSDSGVRVFFSNSDKLDEKLNAVVANFFLDSDVVLSSVQALLAAGANPDANDKRVLENAANTRRPMVVRELLRGGADPRGVPTRRTVPHLVARESSDSVRVEILRHFILGLQDASRNYDWNLTHDVLNPKNTPLNLLMRHHADKLRDNRNVGEIHSLIYERGGRCASLSIPACAEIPSEDVNVRAASFLVGDVYAVQARNFGGDVFALSEPDSGMLRELAERGWSARSEPDRVVMSRMREGRRSDGTVSFTIAARAADGTEVRRYNVEMEVSSQPFAPDAPGSFSATLGGAVGAPRAELSWTIPRASPAILRDYRFWSGAATPDSPPDCSQADFGNWRAASSTAPGFLGVHGEQTSASAAAVYGECRVYAIAAKNEIGEGEAAESAVIYIQHPPSPPRALAASVVAGGLVSVRWLALETREETRGAAVAGYEISRETDGAGGFVSLAFVSAASELFYTDSGAPKDANLKYRVRAQSSAGAGEAAESGLIWIPTAGSLPVTVNYAGGGFFARRTAADGGGTIRAGDLVTRGTTVEFVTDASEEYGIVRWTNNGAEVCGPESPCVLTADADLDVRVALEFLPRTISYSEIPNDQSGGTLTAPVPSGGATLRGEAVIFTATPAAGWFVEAWTGSGAACAPGPECALTASADLYVTVRFGREQTTATLTYAELPANREGGTLTADVGSGSSVAGGTTVDFVAIPAAGWTIAAWQGDGKHCRTDDQRCALTARGNLHVTVRFAELRWARGLVLPLDGGGGALTLIGLEGLDVNVADGLAVTYAATPAAGWTIAAWQGDGAGCARDSLECALTADRDLYVTVRFAQFRRARGAVAPAGGGGGAVTLIGWEGLDVEVELGVTVTYAATPAAGWTIAAWQGDGGNCATDSLECALTADADLYVTVHFAEVARVAHAMLPADGRGGTLTLAGLGEDNVILKGRTVTFTATPAAGWFVEEWTGSGAVCAPGAGCALTATADLHVTVHFAERQNTATLTYASIPADGAGGTLTLGGGAGATVAGGTAVTFAATPAAGWTIAAWEGDGRYCPADNGECALTANENLYVTVRFVEVRRVRGAVLPAGGGGLTLTGWEGDDIYVESGLTVTFAATPTAGWTIAAWQGDGASCAADSLECALTADRDLHVTVRFYQVRRVRGAVFPASGVGGGLTLAGLEGRDVTVESGLTVTFVAQPTAGWTVVAWEGSGGNCAAGAVECALTADRDLLVTARFAEAARVDRGVLSGGGALTLDGLDDDDIILTGSTVTFRAIPEPGWTIVAWQGDGEHCAADSLECEVKADGDLHVTVSFAEVARIKGAIIPADGRGGRLTLIGLDGGDFVWAGGTVTFLAAPTAGWSVAAWEGSGGGCAAGAVECALKADGDLSVTARFNGPPRICDKTAACDNCLDETDKEFRPEKLCVVDGATGDFEGVSQDILCGALRGDLEGGGKICSGVDGNGTFCVMDSTEAFPCRGLFRHVLKCNMQFNRTALNPFFCGRDCGAQSAIGKDCGR